MWLTEKRVNRGVWSIIIVCGIVLVFYGVKQYRISTTPPSAEEVAEWVEMERELAEVEPGDLVVYKEGHVVYVVWRNLGTGERILLTDGGMGLGKIERQAKGSAPYVHCIVKRDDEVSRVHWLERLVDQIAGLPTTVPAP